MADRPVFLYAAVYYDEIADAEADYEAVLTRHRWITGTDHLPGLSP